MVHHNNASSHSTRLTVEILRDWYIPFFDVPTRQEGKVWVFEDNTTPTMVKRQRHQ